MKKVYFLASCSTCQKILKIWNLGSEFAQQNIKEEKITAKQIDEMIKLAGSAEALFSRRSMKYQAMGLKDKTLSESDYRNLILEEYTFLKRPVLVVGKRIFIGNAPTVVNEAKEYLDSIK